MQVRIILALALVAGCTLCGKTLAEAARRRVRLLCSLSEGVKLLRTRMMSLFEPVAQLLCQSECPALAQVGNRMDSGRSAAQAWTEVKARTRRQGGQLDALNDGDRQVLDQMFEHLGESGREAQALMLSGAAQALELRCEDARKRAAEADRLYVTLGLLIGMMLALMVI